MAYADAVRRDLAEWLQAVEDLANVPAVTSLANVKASDLNRRTARLFDEVSVAGLLLCISEGVGE